MGLQKYSCLENSMNRGAWQNIVHGVAKRVEHDWATKQTKQINTKEQSKDEQVRLEVQGDWFRWVIQTVSAFSKPDIVFQYAKKEIYILSLQSESVANLTFLKMCTWTAATLLETSLSNHSAASTALKGTRWTDLGSWSAWLLESGRIHPHSV